MDLKVLSQKHQKNTLRGKKNKKETTKNILVSPYQQYWPLLHGKDVQTLEEILRNHLPKMREQKIIVPWKEIKDIPKDQRVEFRRKYNKIESNPLDSTIKSNLIFGINEVTKLLEKNEASSVLLADDVTPRLMVKHVVDLAVLRQTPLLVIPKFREISQSITGINSVAVALKAGIDEDSRLYVIDQAIRGIYVNYPVPKNHINYNRGNIKFFNAEEKETDKEYKNIHNDKILDVCEESRNDILDSNFTYLYRESKSLRVFVPASSQNQKVTDDKMEVVDSNGFLSFNNDISEMVSNDSVKYKSLIVKQIRSNKDRNKKKIAILKNKKQKN